jgi:protein phosphatase
VAVSEPTPVGGPAGGVVVHVFGRTDVGRVRDHNEDSFLVADLSTENASLQPEVRTHTIGDAGTLFMVADGLGGAAAGEIASDLAINTVYEEVRDRWAKGEHRDPQAFAGALKAATDAANSKIFAYALEHPEHRGLGTTATVAGVWGDTVYLAQVGDSRAYLIRHDEAIQITKDQSLMARLVEAGELTQEEADRSERRNIILQALGPEPSVRIDLTHQKLRRGDALVLCSDGLSGLVKKEEIAEVVTSTGDLVQACKELIDRANENGGPDNITVIVAHFDGDGLAAPEKGDKVGHTVFPLPGSTPQGGTSRADEMPTAPTTRRAAPPGAGGPDLGGVGTLLRETIPNAVVGGDTKRAVLTAVVATVTLLGVFLLARQMKGPVRHAGAASAQTADSLPPGAMLPTLSPVVDTVHPGTRTSKTPKKPPPKKPKKP